MSAKEKPIYTESLVAGEDLSSYQYYGVAMSDDFEVDLMDDVTDKPAGVLLNEPESGQQALVGVIGRFPVVAGEALPIGSLIRFNDSGKACVWDPGTDTTAYVAGQVLEAASDEDEVVSAMINCVNPARGDC